MGAPHRTPRCNDLRSHIVGMPQPQNPEAYNRMIEAAAHMRRLQEQQAWADLQKRASRTTKNSVDTIRDKDNAIDIEATPVDQKQLPDECV